MAPGSARSHFSTVPGAFESETGCDISAGAQLYTHSTARRCVSGRAYNSVDRASTTLGNNVFVGAGAVILMGVTIGDGVVIGAGRGRDRRRGAVHGRRRRAARRIATVVVDGNDVRFESVAGEPDSGRLDVMTQEPARTVRYASP